MWQGLVTILAFDLVLLFMPLLLPLMILGSLIGAFL